MTTTPPLIAHVLNGLKFGGCENLCLQVIRNAPVGVRHVLFNLDPSRIAMKPTFLACPELVIIDVPYARERRGRFILEMARELKRVRADGVLVYAFGVHVFVALAARIAGVRRTITHAGNPPPDDPQQRTLWKAIVLASRVLDVQIMSCSAMVDRELRRLAGALPTGSRPLLNGVDIDGIEAIASRERANRIHSNTFVIGMVARFDAIKDHETLLKGFALVHHTLANVELWLIGDGELRASVEDLARTLGVDSVTRFWGQRSDAHALIARTDLLVFSTTKHEGFGIVLAEAMAARVPIVASDVGACREVLAEGTAGRLVPPKDPEKLAEAVIELLTKPAAARALVERALVRARQQFDIRMCAKQYCDSVLHRTARPNGAPRSFR